MPKFNPANTINTDWNTPMGTSKSAEQLAAAGYDPNDPEAVSADNPRWATIANGWGDVWNEWADKEHPQGGQ